MTTFTKENLESFLKEDGEDGEDREEVSPTSLKRFGRNFKNKNLDSERELFQLGKLLFSKEPTLLSRKGKIYSKQSMKQQILQQFQPIDGYLDRYRESLVFFRYHAIVHHLLLFNNISLTGKTYGVSVSNLYRLLKICKFEFDSESFPQEGVLLLPAKEGDTTKEEDKAVT